MMRNKFFVIIALAALILTAPLQAGAQERETGKLETICPSPKVPHMTVVQFSGNTYVNHNIQAFQLARRKHQLTGLPMPMKQGNIGEAKFRLESFIEIETFPSLGCLMLKQLNVKVLLDHYIDLASDYEDGSCIYNELYNLEQELARQDEAFVNDEVLELRAEIKETLGQNSVKGPIVGMNIDEAKIVWKKEIEKMLEDKVAEIKKKADKLRRESDLPEFFDEIEAECAGLDAPPER